MKKQPLGQEIIDNGMKSIIERHPGIRTRYIQGVLQYLENIPGANTYKEAQIYRVVFDKTALNFHNKVIKTAFMAMYRDLYPQDFKQVEEDDLIAA